MSYKETKKQDLDRIISIYAPTPRMNNLVRRLLRQLIIIARDNHPSVTYGELARRIGYGSNRLGSALGAVYDIVSTLSRERGLNIPTLNGLCHLQTTGLPAARMDICIPEYGNLSEQEKRQRVDELNKRAYSYDKWDQILKMLE